MTPTAPVLRFLTGDRAGTTVALDRERLVLGRDAGNDVPVPDGAVSRQHCVLERTGDGWRLVDVEARNPTRRNGRRITGPVLLAPGDRLRLGTTELEFTAPEPAGTRLRCLSGAAAGRSFAIAGTRAVIGRAAAAGAAAGTNDVELDDDGASREHAELRQADGVWELRDLGSRNGTALDGEAVRAPARLRPGGRIRVGTTDLEWRDGRVDDLAGSVCGSWTLLARIGAGTSGVVYRARGADGTVAAVKILHPHLAVDAAWRARWTTAAQRPLTDPHLVPVLGALAEAPFPALLLGWQAGGSLADRLAEGEPLPPDQVLRLLSEATAGLAAAAHAGTPHLGLRPENLLIDADGALRVADLGLCAGWDPLHPAESPDPRWIAPEENAGRAVDGASNRFSLGLIGWAALTGQLPFSGANRSALAADRIGAQLPPPERYAPATPPGLTLLLAKLLAREPSDRPVDWEAVRIDLDAIAAGRDVTRPADDRSVLALPQQRRASGSTRALPAVRRRPETLSQQFGLPPLAWGGLLVVGLMIAGAIAFSGAREQPPPVPPVPPVPPALSGPPRVIVALPPSAPPVAVERPPSPAPSTPAEDPRALAERLAAAHRYSEAAAAWSTALARTPGDAALAERRDHAVRLAAELATAEAGVQQALATGDQAALLRHGAVALGIRADAPAPPAWVAPLRAAWTAVGAQAPDAAATEALLRRTGVLPPP